MFSRQFQLLFKHDVLLSPKLWSKMDLIRTDFRLTFVPEVSRVPDEQIDMFF
jgi:hypothetical protein